MENLAVLERQQQFDFQQNGIEVMDFDSVLLEIKLLLSFQYCQIFHNLEVY